MHPSDKAVLRLVTGLAAAVLIAYGSGMPAPYVVCLLSVLLLCKPGPPLPLVKGLVLALMLVLLVTGGLLMVPLLEHYAVSGVMLTAVVLYALFYSGQQRANPLVPILVIAFTLIPVVGVFEQALAGMVAVALGIGVAIGTLVSGISHAFFPDPEPARPAGAAVPAPDPQASSWIALRATVIVMPVVVLALTDPSFYVAAVMKSVALGQQAGETDARHAGRELVGSTLMGALLALVVWFGLSVWPSLWMLCLWLMAAGLYAGSGIFRTRRSRFSPSFWSNALVTSLILLGPAIADSAGGKGVLEASVVRVCLFVGLAFYAWGTVRFLENRRAADPAVLSGNSN